VRNDLAILLCCKVLDSYSERSHRILGTLSYLRVYAIFRATRNTSCPNNALEQVGAFTLLTFLYRYDNHEMQSNIIAANTISLERVSSMWEN
jgi:hypothetical protein